jgi:hypothetical protein
MKLMIWLSNTTILKSWGVTILPKFTIHKNFFKISNAHNVEKKHYNKKGEKLSMFLMWNDSRCLNWFIFTTFCSNTYK